YDEMEEAAALARRLGARHEAIPLRPTPADTIDMLPLLARRMDQPFADSSALAVSHLAKAGRRHVTVALSGAGADELFLGHGRDRAQRLAARVAALLGSPRIGGAAARWGGSALRRVVRSAPARRNLAGRAGRFLDALALAPLDRNDAWLVCIAGEKARSVL